MWNRCIAVRYLSTLICAIMFINILYQAISQSAQSKGALSRKSLTSYFTCFPLPMALNRLLSPIKKVKAPWGGKERYVLRNYSALEQQMGQKKKKFPVTFNLKNYASFHLFMSPPISTKMIIRRIMYWNYDYVTCFFSVWNKEETRWMLKGSFIYQRWAGWHLNVFVL